MESLLKRLSETLDRWVWQHDILVTETEGSIVAAELSVSNTRDLVGLVASARELPYAIEDASPSPIALNALTQELEPYKVTIAKPPVPVTVSLIVTNAGLIDWLSRTPSRDIVWVPRLSAAFETFAVRFSPWGNNQPFTSEAIQANPRRVVRETGTERLVVSNPAPWLLRSGNTVPWDDSPVKIWADIASLALVRSLANELEGENTLIFRGPPVGRFETSAAMAASLTQVGFAELQSLARWVLESEQEMETRHGLATAELGRTNVGSGSAAELFRRGAKPALEGAKIANQLGLQKLSLDSLKAMADLRKSVSEEAAKLSDATRQLASATATAVFAGVGVIAARLTSAIEGPIAEGAIVTLGIVLVMYVLAIVFSGWEFMLLQSTLRTQWRDKLYRFLPEAEYKQLVLDPTARAEAGFNMAAYTAIGLALALLVAVFAAASAPKSSSSSSAQGSSTANHLSPAAQIRREADPPNDKGSSKR